MKPTLLILAAGMGSRYGGLKQLDKIGPSGETILDYSVFDAIQSGFGKVVFIIRHEIEEEFISFFKDRFKGKIETAFVYQELDKLPGGFTPPATRQKPWGTAHAILMAKDVIKEPFAVINADDFYGREAFTIMAHFLTNMKEREVKEYALAGYLLDNTLSEFGGVSRGVCMTDQESYLTTVTETKNIQKQGEIITCDSENGGPTSLAPETIVSMNTWAFGPEVFDATEKLFEEFLKEHGNEEKSEFYIPTVADYLIKTGKAKFKVLPCSEKWFGVTYPEDRPTAVESFKNLAEKGVYPSNLW